MDRTEVKPYLYRLQSMAMQAMKFLEIRPSLVTDDMRLIMQKNQSLMGKYLRISPGKPADVVPAEIIPVGNPLAVKQLETLTDTVDVVQAVVRRLKKEGVENMSVQSLISALPKLVDAVNKMQNRQIKTGNLTQINISSNAKDIEESMLALVKGDN